MDAGVKEADKRFSDTCIQPVHGTGLGLEEPNTPTHIYRYIGD
jgi:hypothetical protein